MGDIADLALEAVVDTWSGPACLPYPRDKVCRCCGQGGLHWATRGGRWRLMDAGGIHCCPVNPLAEATEAER